MTTRTVTDNVRALDGERIFAWPRKSDSLAPMLAAFLISAAAFAFVLHSLRIDLGSYASQRINHAALILAGDDMLSMELKRRAREEGPFPMRFNPAADDAVAKLQQTALEAMRFSPPPYAPKLRPLHESAAVETPSLAPVGEAMLPRRSLPTIETMQKMESRPQPVLTPISGISEGDMPRELPEFAMQINGKSLRDSWRFMIHADANGRVLDCIALNGGESTATAALVEWLRKVEFAPSTKSATRWFAVDLGIINQATDAPGPH
ncbi:MAG: hypothetical protein RLZ22_440 [Verrucomicrobiota bacterium]|jgi:hypothetical protein